MFAELRRKTLRVGRFRTLPKTRKPCATRTFAVPQPMPVDVPVMTTLRMQISWAEL